MKLNRFYLGILIVNILIFLILFLVFIVHPEVMPNHILTLFLFILGIIGIITNCFNAFPKEKEDDKQ